MGHSPALSVPGMTFPDPIRTLTTVPLPGVVASAALATEDLMYRASETTGDFLAVLTLLAAEAAVPPQRVGPVLKQGSSADPGGAGSQRAAQAATESDALAGAGSEEHIATSAAWLAAWPAITPPPPVALSAVAPSIANRVSMSQTINALAVEPGPVAAGPAPVVGLPPPQESHSAAPLAGKPQPGKPQAEEERTHRAPASQRGPELPAREPVAVRDVLAPVHSGQQDSADRLEPHAESEGNPREERLTLPPDRMEESATEARADIPPSERAVDFRAAVRAGVRQPTEQRDAPVSQGGAPVSPDRVRPIASPPRGAPQDPPRRDPVPEAAPREAVPADRPSPQLVAPQAAGLSQTSRLAARPPGVARHSAAATIAFQTPWARPLDSAPDALPELAFAMRVVEHPQGRGGPAAPPNSSQDGAVAPRAWVRGAVAAPLARAENAEAHPVTRPVAAAEVTTAPQQRSPAAASAAEPEDRPRVIYEPGSPAAPGSPDTPASTSVAQRSFPADVRAATIPTERAPSAPERTHELTLEPALDQSRRASRPTAAREISLRVPVGPPSIERATPEVAIHLSERAGQVHLAIRAADPRLSGSLRESLGELVARFESSGYRAEAWTPTQSSPTLSLSHAAEAARSDQGSSGSFGSSAHSQGHGQAGGDRGRQQQGEERQPHWFEEFEQSIEIENTIHREERQ